MSVNGGPDISEQGLVLYLDAANTKSYPRSGTLWNDLSGNNNNGSLVNSPTFSSINGGTFLFNGTNQYFFISNAIANTMNAISIWVNMVGSGFGPIIQYGADAFDSGQWTWGMTIYPAATHGFNEGPLGYPTTGLYTEGVDAGVWKYFTLVRNDGGNVKMYKNGQLVGTKVGGGTTAVRNTGDRLQIGKAGTYYSNFYLSSVSIHDRTLSAQEVLQNFRATRRRFGV